MLPFFKLFGKAPVNEVAPIPTPKEKLANQTKKQKERKEEKLTVNSFSKLRALIKLRDNDRQTNKTSKRTS